MASVRYLAAIEHAVKPYFCHLALVLLMARISADLESSISLIVQYRKQA